MSHGPRMLTEVQIDAIAHEARTKSLSEIGRHVMPLIQHIVGMDMRCCRGCALWDSYDEGRQFAVRGECTHPAMAMDLSPVDRPGVMTPANWCCRGWVGVPEGRKI